MVAVDAPRSTRPLPGAQGARCLGFFGRRAAADAGSLPAASTSLSSGALRRCSLSRGKPGFPRGPPRFVDALPAGRGFAPRDPSASRGRTCRPRRRTFSESARSVVDSPRCRTPRSRKVTASASSDLRRGGRGGAARPSLPANRCLQAHREHVTLALEQGLERVRRVDHAEVDVEPRAGRRSAHRPRRVEVAEQPHLSSASVVSRDWRRR
jgi:hypothetical protein